MGRIQIMEAHLANMIAAGEVIERPSSIIKELVENSVDAHASHVEVRIQKAGREKITVRDDGDGMDASDAVLAFRRHASSKLLDEYQLFKIRTMGFRGEALPSIAAVSKVTMYTSTGEGVGSKVSVTEEQLHREDYRAAKGTLFEVEELFYNTPVRLKYLKSDHTEVASCLEVMQRLALSFPEVAFDFYIDDRLSFSTTGRGDLLEVIARLYGNDLAKRMIPFHLSSFGFEAEGFLGKPEVTRATRYYIITILNQRNVYIPQIQKAVISGYSDYIFNSKYPFVILRLKVDHSLVDVNVHPSKKEVRLSNESELSLAIEQGIRQSLKELNAIHEVALPHRSVESQPLFETVPPAPEVVIERPMKPERSLLPETPSAPFAEGALSLDALDLEEEVLHDVSTEKKEEETPVSALPPGLRIIGQLHKTYIVMEGSDGFYLCDQHAANERINYERFQKLLNARIDVSDLLVPMVLNFSPSDIQKLTERKLELLAEIGLKMEPFGLNAMKISSVPLFIKEADEEAYVQELVEQVIRDDRIDLEALRKHVIATMACKASIKANDALTMREMEDLIQTLFRCENATCCPHGRPTIVHFTTYDVEKMFKRSGI